jgi:hypothetical protein
VETNCGNSFASGYITGWEHRGLALVPHFWQHRLVLTAALYVNRFTRPMKVVQEEDALDVVLIQLMSNLPSCVIPDFRRYRRANTQIKGKSHHMHY